MGKLEHPTNSPFHTIESSSGTSKDEHAIRQQILRSYVRCCGKGRNGGVARRKHFTWGGVKWCVCKVTEATIRRGGGGGVGRSLRRRWASGKCQKITEVTKGFNKGEKAHPQLHSERSFPTCFGPNPNHSFHLRPLEEK